MAPITKKHNWRWKLKHGLNRGLIVAAAAVPPFLASPSFRHYVDSHPQVAAVVPIIVAVIHALKKQPA